MCLRLCRNDVFKLLKERESACKLDMPMRGCGLHTIPELLLVIEVVGHLEFHRYDRKEQLGKILATEESY